MQVHETRHPRVLGLAVATLVIAVLTALTGPPTPTSAAATTVVASEVTNPDVLIVAPGRIGTLKMGTTKAKAKKRGWIRYERPCGWGAGPRALRLDQDGNEVFKAYPDKMARGKVLSMHAMGDVVTTKGIWARGLGATERPGSSLDQIKAAYPTVKLKGSWQDYVTEERWPVYTTGRKTRGWLDFYLDPTTTTVIFIQVRANGVKWGQPSFGC
jgi:hypothetical protein